MKKKITESTAFKPLGYPIQSRLFRVDSGEYAGRRVALIAVAPGVVALFRSDTPGTSWLPPVTVISDFDDGAFDAVIMPNGDLHVVYGEASTHFLVCRKLTYADGCWTAGDKVTVYNGSACYDPSLAADPTGRIWVAWARYSAPNRSIYVKSSADDGATWGEGPTDAGDMMQGDAVFAGVKVLTDHSRVHVVLFRSDVGLSHRSRLLTGGEWSGALIVASDSGISYDFDAAAASRGRLGLVYDSGVLRYCECNDAGWSAPLTISDCSGLSPQLRFVGDVPVVTFLKGIGTCARSPRYTDRRRGVFGEPVPFDGACGYFDSVMLYHAATTSFENRTSEAASSAVADLNHSQSGCLLYGEGDAVYLGMDARFRLAHFRFSTAGAGGTLRYAFWSGIAWQTFVPADGASDLNVAEPNVTLWADYDALPANWQKTVVNGVSRFWVRIDVTAPFTVGPVGDQVTSAAEAVALNLRR